MDGPKKNKKKTCHYYVQTKLCDIYILDRVDVTLPQMICSPVLYFQIYAPSRNGMYISTVFIYCIYRYYIFIKLYEALCFGGCHR